MNYDKAHCFCVNDIGATGNSLKQEVNNALAEFYTDVNEYFKNGEENYKNGNVFVFAFEMASAATADSDTSAEVMMQYAARKENPQDKHFKVSGGAACKYVTEHLILPAYTYLSCKCNKLGFVIRASDRRYYGAPIECVPAKTPVKGKSKLVTRAESPKLYDLAEGVPSCGKGSRKTTVFT